MTTNKEAIMEIYRIDEKLRILRESWIDSKLAKKEYWMDKINRVLEERIEVMKIRDGRNVT